MLARGPTPGNVRLHHRLTRIRRHGAHDRTDRPELLQVPRQARAPGLGLANEAIAQVNVEIMLLCLRHATSPAKRY